MADSRRIWLTGASSGIGAHMAETLLKSGARLVLTARSVETPVIFRTLSGAVMSSSGDLSDHQRARNRHAHRTKLGRAGHGDSECRHL